MAFRLRYDRAMRWLAVSLFVFVAYWLVGLPGANAQVVNWGPSVTSMGFGGNNHLSSVPPSVTSLGFGRTGSPGRNGHFGFFTPASPGLVNPRHHPPIQPVWGGYYAYPVYIDSGDAYQSVAEPGDNPDEYRGGPTIFDRRGDGQYPERRFDPSPEAVEPDRPAASEAVADQPQTVLVFKDGHQANVDNYAIVGNTLYDLTGGLRHKIALADLDLTATARENDDRGVDFELPALSPSN